jgi:lysophospholipase L1-like esterase
MSTAPGNWMRERPHLKRAAFVAAGLIVAIAACEAMLRFGLGLGNPILIQPDVACSYILKPDQDVVRFFVHTHINRYGMRSGDLPAQRAPGAMRVMFVGDSVTYGTTRVDQRDIFTEVLRRDLPAIVHRPVEVLNASAGAWAPDNELGYLRSRGIFQSDLVLLVLNDGDLSQPRSTIAQVGDDLPQRRPATAIGELYERYIRPRVLHLAGKQDAGDSADANASEVVRENITDLDAMNQLVTAQGARLLLVFIPFRKGMPTAALASQAMLTQWCHAHGVGMFDLTAAESSYTADQISLDGGIHLNAKGHRIVAEAIEREWPKMAGDR